MTDSRPPAVRRPFDHGVWISLLIAAAILLITQPAELCPGDAFTARFEAIHLLETGRLGVDPAVVASAGEPGQYYVQNPRTGSFHPKYGVLHTFVAIGPILTAAFIADRLGDHDFLPLAELLSGNLFHLLQSLLIVFLTYRVVARLSTSVATRIVFTLSSGFATFSWFYFRAHTLDGIQVLLLLAGALALFHVMRPEPTRSPERLWVPAAIAGLAFGLLVLAKPVHLLWLPPAGLAVLWSACRNGRSWTLPVAFAVPAATLTILFFVSNAHRFGSPFDFGYSHWAREARPLSGDPWVGALGLIFDAQHGALIAYPILLGALWRWGAFWKRFRPEAVFIAALAVITLMVNAFFVNWAGHFSSGPRYLLPVLPLVSLPFALILDDIGRLEEPVRRVVAAITGLVLLFLSLQQLALQSMPFYFQYEVRDAVRKTGSQSAESHVEDTATAHLALQMAVLRNTRQSIALLRSVEVDSGAEEAARLRAYLADLARPNFLLYEMTRAPAPPGSPEERANDAVRK